jgi:ABC-type multidrug transport system fused ATPase/permease subunit
VIQLFKSALAGAGFTTQDNIVILAILVSASVLFVTFSGFTFANMYFSAVVGETLRRETKFKLFQQLLHAQYETVLQQGRGSILHDLTDPPVAVTIAMLRLSTLFTAIFNSVVLLAFMLYLSWWATLFVGILGLLGVHGIRKLTDTKARAAGTLTYTLHADESRVAVDAIDGIKITKGYGLEASLSGRMRSLLNQEIRPAHRLSLFRYVPAFINELAAGVIVVVLAGISLLMPSLGLSFATLVGFLMAIRQCGASIANVSYTIVELQNIRPRLSVLVELEKTLPRERSGPEAVEHVSELRLAGVSLRYATRHRVLHEIDLTMKKGSVTAIVGPTGSGKSTIANLIVGLIQPTSGRILVDGRDLAEMDLSVWRKKMGYVPQDPFLFNTSIRNNIVLWDETISQQELDRVAELAQLREFIVSIPNGYETMVGDRGLEISGGQAQRIALARAILRKPEVLVFDEATSALDNLTEKAVYEAISALRPGAIVIVIAHRLSTIRDADQIVVLEGGNVVELGTHDSLVRDRGSYSRLYGTEAIHD